VDDVEPSGGEVNFTVGADDATDTGCAVAVVWADDGDDDLDIDNDNEADGIGDSAPDIDVVEGVGQADETTFVDDVTPEGGEVSFTVNADDAADTGCAVAVVFADDGDDDLDLDDDNEPIEDFAVSGNLTFNPAEAANGANVTGVVTFVAKNVASGSFVVDPAGAPPPVTINYDGNDNFRETGNPVTEDGFEAELSEGDTVTANPYATNPDLASSLNIDTDTPTPTTLALTQTGNDIDIDVTPNNPNFATMDSDDQVIFIRGELDEDDGGNTDACDAGDIGPFLFGPNGAPGGGDDATAEDFDILGAKTKAVEVGEDNDGIFESLFEDQPTGCFIYGGVQVVDGDIGDVPGFSGAVAIGVGDDARPLLIDAAITTDNPVGATVDDTDEGFLQFNEPMQAGIVNGRFRSTDPDNEQFDIDCDVNATCTLVNGDANADNDTTDTVDANSRVNFVLTADPIKVAGPVTTLNTAQMPLTITELSTEFNDAGGNQANLADSTDKTLENEF
jgi:hypothetical protein